MADKVTLKDRLIKGKNAILTVLGVVAGVCVEIGMLADYLPKDSRLHGVAAALGILGAALKWPDKPPVLPAALLALGLGFALPAHAATFDGSPFVEPPAQPPAAATIFCMDAAKLYCARPGVGFSGVGYDFTTKTVAKDVTFSGLVEMTLGHKVAALFGGGFQTGDAQGLAVQGGLEYMPINMAVLYSRVVVGTKSAQGLSAGYVIRF